MSDLKTTFGNVLLWFATLGFVFYAFTAYTEATQDNAVAKYKATCEVVGHTSVDKWRECAL